ncbi:MAG: hypothetical protein Q9191_001404, partial [Dirinaria sp. TL-2023a]
MDVQIENAIEIAWNPRSEQSLKVQAYDFLNQLRSEPQGWQVCLSLVVRDPRPSEVVRLVALDVINRAIQADQTGPQGRAIIQDGLMTYVRNMYGIENRGSDSIDSPSIQNKITQSLTYLFAEMYKSQWTAFFTEILGLTGGADSSRRTNYSGVVFYLRTLISIHDEIADVMVSRNTEEQQRHTEVKDLVRVRDAAMIALSWQEILSEWMNTDETITELCLTTIGKWVSWIEISLVVNQKLLNMLFELVSSPQQTASNKRRDAAIDTFVEIIGKKMSANDKLELIDVLKIKDVVEQLVNSPTLTDLRSTSSYDTDFAESVAKLVNNTVLDVVKVLDGAQDGDQVSHRGIAQLHDFVPFVLRFFSDEYDEVCSTVIPCLTELLTLLRKKAKTNNPFYSQSFSMVNPILDAVVAKMRYDETSSWGNEDEQTDEAEFQELRKRLQVLQQAVAAVDENTCLDKLSNVVGNTFDRFRSQHGQVDWRDLDLAMHEMFLFGDLVTKHGGLYSRSKPISPAAERLIGMMHKLVESDVASSSHPAIQLQYMEICVRYSAFFEANSHLIPGALEKSLRQHIGNVAENVVRAVNDLLPIKAELAEDTSDNDDLSSDGSDQSASARFNSQLYLYEAVGCVCSAHAVPVENQIQYIRSIITPLFTDLEAHLGSAKTGDERSILQVHHLMMALGTLARGFSDWTPANTSSASSAPAQPVSEEFTQTAEAILVALESLSSSFQVRTAARFAFSRLIGVLGNRILIQLPRWIDGLLSRTSTKDEMALFLRLLDQVVFGFKSEIFDILNILLTPFLERVFAGINEPTNGTDDEIQLQELKREYLGFLLIILNNDLESALVSDKNQTIFAKVITTIEHLATDTSDYSTAKLAFSVLSRMALTWGGPDLYPPQAQLPGSIAAANAQPTLPGFDHFMVERFSPLCWAMPSSPDFNSKDAQAKQALGEAAGLQKTIFLKTGHEYLAMLKNSQLRNMGMGDADIEEYLNALCTLDVRGFKQFFQ